MKIIAITNADTMKKNRVLRILLNGVETLNNTVNETTVAEITINVDVTVCDISNVSSNAKIIMLLINTMSAPGRAAFKIFHKNLPLTSLLLGSRASKNDGIPITR